MPKKEVFHLYTFYDAFADLCVIKGVSLRQACIDIGLSPSAYGKWKGKNSAPNPMTLRKIEKYFNAVIVIDENGIEILDPPESHAISDYGESWLAEHATAEPKDEGLKKILAYLGGLSEEDMLKLRDIVDTLLK